MQRNPYCPLNGPSFFSTIEIPSQCRKREFEEVIMVEVLIGEMFGSD